MSEDQGENSVPPTAPAANPSKVASFVPDAHYNQEESSGMSNNANTSKTTLWMGELEPWYDELSVKKIWLAFSLAVEVKMIRDKYTGVNLGYCFVDFGTPENAAKALQLNGQFIPNTQRLFRLNWASGNGLNDRKEDRAPEYSIFVGDLTSEVTEADLFDLFSKEYPSCKSTKIMCDISTNQSRGYGFVRFSDEADMQRALHEMQGRFCGSRPMRISTATPKNKGVAFSHYQQMQQQMAHVYYSSAVPPVQTSNGVLQGVPASLHHAAPLNQYTDPHNTTVFVGGLSSVISENELRDYFAPFGDITYVKIPPGKGCGFVQFVQRLSAEQAISSMQGYPIGASRVRLSWGRSQATNGPHTVAYRQGPAPMVYPQELHTTSLYDGTLTGRSAIAPMSMASVAGVPGVAGATGVPLPTSDGANGITSKESSPDNDTLGATANGTETGTDPSEPLPMARLNELYEAARLGTIDRLQGNDKFNGVYAQ